MVFINAKRETMGKHTHTMMTTNTIHTQKFSLQRLRARHTLVIVLLFVVKLRKRSMGQTDKCTQGHFVVCGWLDVLTVT